MGGDLLSHVLDLNKAKKLMELDRAARLFQGMCQGVDYLHKKSLVHRDIKPENVLLNADHTVAKISDFGLTRVTDSLNLARTLCGTPAYFAPELVQADLQRKQHGWDLGTVSEGSYTVAVDVWALGCCLYIMLVGAPPFSGDNLFEQIRAGQYSLNSKQFATRPQEAKLLVEGMMEVSPTKRMSIERVLMDPWFES